MRCICGSEPAREYPKNIANIQQADASAGDLREQASSHKGTAI